MQPAVQTAIDIVDSTWIGAPPAVVAAAVAVPGNWACWWPDLSLRVDELRGEKGLRWFVDAVGGAPGALHGTAEVWLEPTCGATVAHFFLRVRPAPGATLTGRARARIVEDYRRMTKTAFWALGDELDPGRIARHVLAPRTAVD